MFCFLIAPPIPHFADVLRFAPFHAGRKNADERKFKNLKTLNLKPSVKASSLFFLIGFKSPEEVSTL